jgi:HK97 gp10 family phage protein
MARTPKQEWLTLDTSEIDPVIADLKSIRQRLKPEMRQATSASAMRIRNRARANWKQLSSGRTTGNYPKTITLTVTESNAATVTAEIGPEKGKQGSFGHIFEFGTSKSPPHPHLVPAWDAELEPYTLAMAQAAVNAVFP